MKITDRIFGRVNGEAVAEYTIVNDAGMAVTCINYGCVITKIIVPDRHGNHENIVLGFDTLDEYIKWSPYFGAIVGRVAGRIKGARFELDGKEYQLADNQSPNHLHGGNKGFSSVIWKSEKIMGGQGAGVRFIYLSPDGEEGYPGNLETTVTYLLNNENELLVTCEGRTDQKTLVNLTNHTYFNLSGNLKRDISSHKLRLESDRFLELDKHMLPTGKIIDSQNTPFDFNNGRKLEEGIISSHPQNILAGNGYDHPLIFAKSGQKTIVLSEEESGRTLHAVTNQPAVVLYTANGMEGSFTISGIPAKNYLGVCLETQGYPDAIHHPEFPSVVLTPEERYFWKTKYRFFTNTSCSPSI